MHNKAFFSSSFSRWFGSYPLFIQIALVCIITSVAMFLLIHIILVCNLIIAVYRELRVKRAEETISEQLTDSLLVQDTVSEKDFNRVVRRVKNLIVQNQFLKQILIDQIISYRRNFSDGTERILRKLFSNLNLVESAINKLRNGTWELKAKGLREIQEMSPSTPLDALVDPLLNDKNDDLRIEAQAAYIRLHREDPFRFLHHAKEDLSPWHQILLYDVVSNSPDLNSTGLEQFLVSSNPSVVTFAIKLVVYYQNFSAIPALVKLLGHDDVPVKQSTIAALAKLGAEEAEALMIERFPTEPLSVKLKILESIGAMSTGKQLDFLKEQFLQANDFILVKTAGCALANYPKFDKNKLLKEINEDIPDRTTIINHCTNNLARI